MKIVKPFKIYYYHYISKEHTIYNNLLYYGPLSDLKTDHMKTHFSFSKLFVAIISEHEKWYKDRGTGMVYRQFKN